MPDACCITTVPSSGWCEANPHVANMSVWHVSFMVGAPVFLSFFNNMIYDSLTQSLIQVPILAVLPDRTRPWLGECYTQLPILDDTEQACRVHWLEDM